MGNGKNILSIPVCMAFCDLSETVHAGLTDAPSIPVALRRQRHSLRSNLWSRASASVIKLHSTPTSATLPCTRIESLSIQQWRGNMSKERRRLVSNCTCLLTSRCPNHRNACHLHMNLDGSRPAPLADLLGPRGSRCSVCSSHLSLSRAGLLLSSRSHQRGHRGSTHIIQPLLVSLCL